MRAGKGLFLVFSLCPFLGAQAVPTPPRKPAWAPGNYVSQEQRAAITKRMLFEKEPFMKSYEATKFPQSLGLFLREDEYERMSGNPGTGYLDPDPDFSWPWEDREVSISFKSSAPETRIIKPQAWDAVIKHVAENLKLKLNPKARIQITGAAVLAFPKGGPDLAKPEVTIEARVKGPGGTLIVFRRTEARPTLGDAVGAAVEFVVNFARVYGDPAGAKKGGFPWH